MKKTLLFFALILFLDFYSFAQWTQKADFKGSSNRSMAVGFSIGNKGYIGTGSESINCGLPVRCEKDYKDFWEYDPSNNKWTQKTDFPGTARNGAVCFSIGTKGYIGLGWSEGYVKNDFWEYDPENDSWRQIADFPATGRQIANGFSVGTKGYVVGGHDGSYRNDFWEWDSTTNAWSQKQNFGGLGRMSAVGFSIGSNGYFGTGTSGIYKNDFWEYKTGINSNSLLFNDAGFVKIFPNPATNKITIEYPKEFDIEIADLNGRQIKSYQQNKINLIIDLKGYPNGIYLLKIISDHKILVEKIIKQ